MISGSSGTAKSKINALERSGVIVSPSPADMGQTLLELINE